VPHVNRSHDIASSLFANCSLITHLAINKSNGVIPGTQPSPNEIPIWANDGGVQVLNGNKVDHWLGR